MESGLLFLYICLYPYILYMVNQMQSDYQTRQDLLLYFRDGEFGAIEHIDERLVGKLMMVSDGDGQEHELMGVYDFTQRLLFDKLWQGQDKAAKADSSKTQEDT